MICVQYHFSCFPDLSETQAPLGKPLGVLRLPYLLCSAVDFLPFAAVHHEGLHSGSQPFTLCCRLLKAMLSEAEKKDLYA